MRASAEFLESPTIHLTARRSRKLSHPAGQFGKKASFTIEQSLRQVKREVGLASRTSLRRLCQTCIPACLVPAMIQAQAPKPAKPTTVFRVAYLLYARVGLRDCTDSTHLAVREPKGGLARAGKAAVFRKVCVHERPNGSCFFRSGRSCGLWWGRSARPLLGEVPTRP